MFKINQKNNIIDHPYNNNCRNINVIKYINNNYIGNLKNKKLIHKYYFFIYKDIIT